MEGINVAVIIEGELVSFNVVGEQGHFHIANNGNLIAILQNTDEWEQTHGACLPDFILDPLISAIEDQAYRLTI